MKCIALLAVVVGSLACSGPEKPPGDAGFGTTTVGSTGGSFGTGGSAGSGTGGSVGNGYVPGTGGNVGAGTGGTAGVGPTWRGDAAMEDNSGAGGGGRGKNKDSDAGVAAVCPAGAMNGGACNIPSLICAAPSGDGGAQQICTCRKSTWSCR